MRLAYKEIDDDRKKKQMRLTMHLFFHNTFSSASTKTNDKNIENLQIRIQQYRFNQSIVQFERFCQ